jgi:hypothetical protein
MRLGEPLDGAGKHFAGLRGRDPARSVTLTSCAGRRDHVESPFFHGVERRAGSECVLRRVRDSLSESNDGTRAPLKLTHYRGGDGRRRHLWRARGMPPSH